MQANLFDYYIAVDWSARNVATPKNPTSDAIWVGELEVGQQKETYFRTRLECVAYIRDVLTQNVRQHKRTIIGYDFDFGFPYGFVDALNLKSDMPRWQSIWNLLGDLINDADDNANNRFEVANYLNSLVLKDTSLKSGPLWGCPVKQSFEFLNPKSPAYPFIINDRISLNKLRYTELREPKAQPVWKLIGSASVGGQTLMGIPHLWRLRNDKELIQHSKIWPLETSFEFNQSDDNLVLHVEIWPGILSKMLDKNLIKDQAQVRAVVNWFSDKDMSGELYNLLCKPEFLTAEEAQKCINEEGWVIGSGLNSTQNPRANSLF